MEQIDVKTLTDNVFTTIGKEWMLVTAGNLEKWNTMTASWGCLGWLWNMPVAVIFIRPERYTHEFIEQNDLLTLSFLGYSDEARKALTFCDTKSGRNFDKAKATGLTPVETEHGSVTFAESRLTLECHKLYKGNIKPEEFIAPSIDVWYGDEKGGYHDVYIVQIINAYES